MKDYRNYPVTDGTPIGARVVDPATNAPVGWGALNGGTVSTGDSTVRIYTTTGGQTPIGFLGPTGQQCRLGPVSGTLLNLNTGTLRIFTVDSQGREQYSITTATIQCFN